MSRPRNKAKGDGLYKDPRSPYWQIDKEFAGFRLRRSSRTTAYSEAKAQVDAWVADVRKRVLLEQLGETPKAGAKSELTINEAVTRYFDEVGARAKSSDQVDAHLAWICANIAPTGARADTKLSEITETMLLELAAIRRAAGRLGLKKAWQPVDEQTINRSVFDALRPVLRRAAVTWKASVAIIDWNGLYTPRSKAGLSTREMPMAKQTEFFAKLRIDLHEPVSFLLIHGARSGAMLAMEWPHVDFDAGIFRVRRKTREPGEHWQEVPMTAASRALLLAQRGRHPKFVWTYVVHRRHARFAKGARRPLTKSVLRQVKRAVTRIGMETFRVHDLRHTMARRTLRTTKNLRVVQRALGHADIATTAIYADVLIDDVRDGLEETAAAAKPPTNPGAPECFTGNDVEEKGKNVA